MTEPMFNTDHCSLPSIPSEAFQFISDCAILPAPAPIFDCPDITLPLPVPLQTPSQTLINSLVAQIDITGPAGPAGDDGPAGPPGDPGDPGTPCGADGCVWWIWCPCELNCSASSASLSSQSSASCPTGDTCDYPPGHWIKLDGSGGWVLGDPPIPCWEGHMYGETAMTCFCPIPPECVVCAYWAFDEVISGTPTGSDIAEDSTGNGWYLQPSLSYQSYGSTNTSLHGGQARRTVGGAANNGLAIGGGDDPGREAPECTFLQSGSVIWGHFRCEVDMVSQNGSNNWLGIIAYGPDWSLQGAGGIGPWNNGDTTVGKFKLQFSLFNVTFTTVTIDVAGLDEDTWYFLALWVDWDTSTVYVRIDNTVYSASVPWSPEAWSTITNRFFATGMASTISYGLDVNEFAWLSEQWGISQGPLTTAQLDALYNLGNGVDYNTALAILTS